MYVPKAPVLGAPTRVQYNLTNLGTSDATGSVVVTLNTPGGLYYEVQGPESRVVDVALRPGEAISGTIEFTPRVTGMWSVSTIYRSSQGFIFGGGGGVIQVKGPVTIRMDSYETVYARIGETVPVELSLVTTEALQDAQLRVTTGSGYGYYDASAGSTTGDFHAGMAQGLVRSSMPSGALSTLRPDGEVNVTLELMGRSAGRYQVIPYVLAEGFAYTSTGLFDARGPIVPFDGYDAANGIQLAVQARALPGAMALAPLTVGLAIFVGAWTLRTRFVR